MAAFDSYPELDAHVAQYRANRDVLLAGLTASGVETIAPADGAFYLYADVSAWTADSEQFAARLLAETGVAVAPGIDFDPVDGGRFVRMSFAGPDGPGAVEVLGNWLSRQPRR
jgi:aspartate/methionine/tyrosine aminotransferase